MNKAYIYLHGAVLLLGLSPVFGKIISLNEGLLTFYRVLFSAIILFFILKHFKVTQALHFKEKAKIAQTGILLTFSWVFFFAGIKYSNISIGVVCFCMASFFTAFLEPILNKSPFRISDVLLSILTLLGVSLIFHFDSSYRLGITLGIISPLFYTLYSIYNKRWANHYDSKLINYYQMIGGTIGLGLTLPVYLFFFPSEKLFPDLKDISYLLVLASLSTVLTYILLTEAFKEISAFTANLSMNLEPIYAIIIAFLFFGESKEVGFSFYIGLSFVVISVLLQAYMVSKKTTS
ncbi:DMT family transporter [Sphingobacterium sp. UT-1RO-CII-1]|uniref:DMT family transporter n=1 Tax=Sphingobacterium sp. UT-1RO-CII-1 TaxID=2995225 RepID=UPI00227BF1CD|nr:DMT family transporter [Sphingobacterium sp. UT-1RO-CII-1]MCY4779760.1 DMT family transporter [Sphingobacterium sp. UT-1RO-CII-1]